MKLRATIRSNSLSMRLQLCRTARGPVRLFANGSFLPMSARRGRQHTVTFENAHLLNRVTSLPGDIDSASELRFEVFHVKLLINSHQVHTST